MPRLPRNAHEQAKRWGSKWAHAEAAAKTAEGCPVVVHRNRVLYWSGLIRKAGINTPKRAYSGLRPSLDRVIHLGMDPIAEADRVAQDPHLLNLRLRSCCAALWLLAWRTDPAKIKGCGRIYAPDDCAPFFHLVEDMMRDDGLRLWVYHYACQLGWNYEFLKGEEHAGQQLLGRICREAA